MKITVTQKNIDKGVRGSCSSDPISLALQDAGFYRPWVSPEGIWAVEYPEGVERGNYPLPYGVLQFVLDFDNGREVYPFEFDLEG